MKTLQLLLVICLFTFLSCGPSAEEKSKLESIRLRDENSKELDNGYISSSAAVENKKDSTHKFIRTAELKFKVNSVIKSTLSIEKTVIQSNGFVTLSNLTSDIKNKTLIPLSADSSLETTYYTTENSMILRVPSSKLDSILSEIAKEIAFLDYRIIKADDIALSLYANKLTQQRINKHTERMRSALDTKAKKLNETTTAEDNLLNRQEQSDNAGLRNLSLSEQINYSTINIIIYQSQGIRREVIANDKNIKAYEPNLFQKMKESLVDGCEILEAILMFIFKLWGLLLSAVIGFFIYKKFLKKN